MSESSARAISLPTTFVIGLPGETDESIAVAVETLPDHILVKLIEFGIKEKFNNATAGFGKEGKTPSEYRAECNKVLEALASGTWAKRGGGRVSTFEGFLKREADKTAEGLVKPGAKYAGKDAAKVSEALQKHEPFIASKRKLWDARKAAPETDGIEIA